MIEIVSFPYFLLVCLNPLKAMAERRRQKAMIRKLRAISTRWPFVSIPEVYFYKKHTDPTFDKPYTGETLHQLRIEYEKERRKCLRK